MTATEWWSPTMGVRPDPADTRAHALSNIVMALREELREVRDENTILRKQQVVYLASLKDLSDEVLRVTKMLIGEREARGRAHG